MGVFIGQNESPGAGIFDVLIKNNLFLNSMSGEYPQEFL